MRRGPMSATNAGASTATQATGLSLCFFLVLLPLFLCLIDPPETNPLQSESNRANVPLLYLNSRAKDP